MTDYLDPTPIALMDAIQSGLEDLKLFRSVELLHGRFRIEDLDQKSFRTPAAFVSLSHGVPEIQHAGQLRLYCEFAVMMVTHTERDNAWALAAEVTKHIHRNTYNFHKLSQPTGFKIIPILSSQERKKNIGLTSVTWSQDFELLDSPERRRDLERVEDMTGTPIYQRGASS